MCQLFYHCKKYQFVSLSFSFCVFPRIVPRISAVLKLSDQLVNRYNNGDGDGSDNYTNSYKQGRFQKAN